MYKVTILRYLSILILCLCIPMYYYCYCSCRYRSVAVASFIGTSYKQQLDCEDLRCLQSESPEELIHVQDTLMAV